MNFPSKCPYCGKDIVENGKQHVFYDDANDKFMLEVHECIHCKKPIFVLSSISHNGFKFEVEDIIHYYPLCTTVELPKRINSLSPKAVNIYSQVIRAKEAGYDALLGAGIRMALEWLVWDYLLKIKEFAEDDLSNLNLRDMISKMDAALYVNICAKLIRLFGNDCVHVRQRYDFSIDEAIQSFEILCSLIDSELNILELQKRLSAQHH